MSKLTIDFANPIGRIKPMNAVNNGPIVKNVRGLYNDNLFAEAGISYARLHDSSFYASYGGEFTVDVHRIFPNFDADPTLPESYIFEPTDKYLADINLTGTKIFYRLGASIEHGYKFGTYPPKDFKKWAVICENIIKHYTQGWANGFCYDIEYWEIWNEPDCRNADGSNPCWQGSDEKFIEMFVIALVHLKTCFPRLKIGGPAFCTAWNIEYTKKLFTAIKASGVNLDFYSFHLYTNSPIVFKEAVEISRNLVDEFGFKNTELILNEWNYIKGWIGEDFLHSLRTITSLKGAAFIAGTMCVCQDSPLDMLMYYDARPCSYNGLFHITEFSPLKGYYSFKMFNELYKAQTHVYCKNDIKDIYTISAINEKQEGFTMISYFSDNDKNPVKKFNIEILGLTPDIAELYLLDDKCDCELVKEINICNNLLEIEMQSNTVLLVKVK